MFVFLKMMLWIIWNPLNVAYFFFIFIILQNNHDLMTFNMQSGEPSLLEFIHFAELFDKLHGFLLTWSFVTEMLCSPARLQQMESNSAAY